MTLKGRKCLIDGQTDRQTDGIAIAYTRYSIYAVARKNQEGKTNLDLLEQEIVSGSGNMQVCTSSQITTPASHHSVFYRPDALPAAQPTASKH